MQPINNNKNIKKKIFQNENKNIRSFKYIYIPIINSKIYIYIFQLFSFKKINVNLYVIEIKMIFFVESLKKQQQQHGGSSDIIIIKHLQKENLE